MSLLTRLIGRLFKSEKGQTLSEYGLILFIIAVACVVVLGVLSGAIQNVLQQVANAL
jgi:pilus assembly protein Flp/PilA